ncbi:bifunctional DNA primase/polymerase [Priestia megaterium]|uniref:bifunctional DNA primase/polymerase n=1 Tax=Priestia megaterium TaxID=1404 RepID=UPI0015966D9A|nr:bifunctional DNA primase/polymerase [Priestia megaterium]
MAITRKTYALHYYDHGLIPIPLCWSNKGKCGCPFNHKDQRQVGKAPIIKLTQYSQRITREIVDEWFTRFPNANIGIVLKDSQLVIVDADSEEAVKDVETLLDPSQNVVVQTRRGKHFYFKTTADTPIYRTTGKGKSKKIDILSNGYIIAPPSVHQNGHEYTWINPPKKTGCIPTVPKFIEQFLATEKAKRPPVLYDASYNTSQLPKLELDALPISEFMKDIIRRGETSIYYKERGYQSRSDAIYGVIMACLKSGLTEEEVCSLLLNPKHYISKKIYAEKKDINWLMPQVKSAKKKSLSENDRLKKSERT